MRPKATVWLVALLALATGACDDAGSSSPATSMQTGSTADTVLDTASATSSSSPSVAPVSATSASRPSVATSSTGSTATQPTFIGQTSTAPSTSSPNPPSTDAASQTPTTGTSNPPPKLTDVDCTGPVATGGFDLLHITAEALPSRYRLTARYSGDTLLHDILVSFDLGGSSYTVTAELFEDGNGVAQIYDSRSPDGVFLDPPQTITPGLVDLTIRDDQVGQLSGTPFGIRVSLKVDGSEIETCG